MKIQFHSGRQEASLQSCILLGGVNLESSALGCYGLQALANVSSCAPLLRGALTCVCLCSI
jgi:hypothetical protein